MTRSRLYEEMVVNKSNLVLACEVSTAIVKHSYCETVRRQFPSIPPSSLTVPEPRMGNRVVPLGTNTAQLLFAPL